MALGGCLTENPAYDGATGSTSEPSPPGSTAEPTTSTSTTSSTSTSTSTGLATTGVGDSEGTSTSTTTIALTTDDTTATTGLLASAELHHYEPANCVEPLWCYGGGDIWNGLDGEVRGAECFDSPIAPPYRVRRIDYTLVAVSGQARLRFQIRSADLQQVLYMSESLGLPTSSGSLQISAQQQPVVEEGRFCVGFVGGDPQSTIGIGADPSSLPSPGQSYFGSDACDEPGLRDVDQFVPEVDPHGAWCLGVEIAAL
ncbi:hypothetical protein [Nannocystis punicea]|uniref:GON domain-containing protein n=1 Tax=Nannocystis punicea TaxID=2995304 RepID=A0ABY7HDC1_9BACT|nr:hypothetical protein [Nannocystis poenicansa]WAS97097.1 hypothetical protein O0S08_13195 [Nannocystis poenicansa]